MACNSITQAHRSSRGVNTVRWVWIRVVAAMAANSAQCIFHMRPAHQASGRVETQKPGTAKSCIVNVIIRFIGPILHSAIYISPYSAQVSQISHEVLLKPIEPCITGVSSVFLTPKITSASFPKGVQHQATEDVTIHLRPHHNGDIGSCV